MTLGDKQKVFTLMVARLILWASVHGYQMTFGETYRTPEQAALNAKNGKGIKNSLHTQRLAVDLNLFKGGVYLTRSEDYKPLGVFWESLSTKEFKTCWGGSFGDGNHFSIEHDGRK